MPVLAWVAVTSVIVTVDDGVLEISNDLVPNVAVGVASDELAVTVVVSDRLNENDCDAVS